MAKIKYNRTGILYYVLNLKLIVLLSNFIFQGARYMEFGELVFKLSITLSFAILLYAMGLEIGWSLFIGHFCNYIFNGQFFVVYRYLFTSKVLTNSKVSYVLKHCEYFSENQHIKDVLFIGSFCRNTLKKSSDIDIRIYHRPTIVSRLFAYLQAMKLRFLGLVHRVPVDIFCFSSLEFLDKIDKNEIPLHIRGDVDFINKYPNSENVYNVKVSL